MTKSKTLHEVTIKDVPSVATGQAYPGFLLEC